MMATMSQQAATMSLPTSLNQSPKRPRLSLKIQASPLLPAKSVTALKVDVDTSSPTAFNTLSNAYALAIEQSSPKSTRPPPSILDSAPKTAINTARPTSLRLVTNASSQEPILFPSQRTQTPGPFTINYPDTPSSYTNSTPLTANPKSNALSTTLTPTFTFTPPQSAHPSDSPSASYRPFSFSAADLAPPSPRGSIRRRATIGHQHPSQALPYTHPLALHSILRNSPLPAPPAIPVSPSRASQRLAEKASKKLCFNNPLTQTITNEKYIKSHIDLLAEDASPYVYSPMELEGQDTTMDTDGGIDFLVAEGAETRDGGQTPGPFEEMRRRMAGLGETAVGAGEEEDRGRKRQRRSEKKRRWVWTIGNTEEDGNDEGKAGSVPATAAALSPVAAIDMAKTIEEPLATLELLRPTVYSAVEERRYQDEDEETKRPGSSHSI